MIFAYNVNPFIVPIAIVRLRYIIKATNMIPRRTKTKIKAIQLVEQDKHLVLPSIAL